MSPETSQKSNFVCIFGRSGSGKTRLLRSLVQNLSPDDRSDACLIGAETLWNEMMQSLQSGAIESFRSKYLNFQRLYVDNLWVLRKRPASAEELCRLFRNRQQAGRMTVVSSEFSLEEWGATNLPLASFLATAKSINLLEKPRRKRPNAEVFHERQGF